MYIPADTEKTRLKGLGYIPNKDPSRCSARVVIPAGAVSPEKLRVLAEAAERFGVGKVTLTSRMSFEVPGIEYASLEAFGKMLEDAGLSVGGTGPKVRPITACKGTVCTHGLYDTEALALSLHERFYLGLRDVRLPAKFKIGVGGCPNNCIKPDLNDIGIIGQSVPRFLPEACTACGLCIPKCPVKCIEITDGKAHNDGRCINCGACIDVCPFQAIEEVQRGCRITLGGTWGKTGRAGTSVDHIFDVGEIGDVVDRVIGLYRELGNPGERLAKTIDRVGFDLFCRRLLDRD